MTAFRTTFAVSIAALLAAVCLTFAPSAGAASVEKSASARVTYWGAISLAKDGAVGFAYDFRTKGAAVNAAQEECRVRSDYDRTCTKVGWVRNACGAVSVRYGTDGFVSRYNFGWGPTKRAAISAAKRNFGGTIRGWVCTTR